MDLASVLAAATGRQGKVATPDLLKHSWTYACVNRISADVANVPLRVELGGEEMPSSPMLKLLERPNEDTSLDGLLYELATYLTCYGRAYLWIGDDEKSLYTVDPGQVKEQVEASGITGYRINNRWVNKDRIIRISRQGAIKMMPSSLDAAREAIELDIACLKFNRLWFEQGGTAGGIVVVKADDIDRASEQRLQTFLRERASGLENAGKLLPMFAPDGITYVPFSDGAGKDGSFTEMRKLVREEICGALHVPPMLVGNLDKSTYANYEQGLQDYVNSTVEPLIELICNDLTRGLETRFPGQVLAVDMANWQLKRELLLRRASQVLQLTGMPPLALTEGRELVGYPEIPALPEEEPSPVKRFAIARKGLGDRDAQWLKFLGRQEPLEVKLKGQLTKPIRALVSYALEHPYGEPDAELTEAFRKTCASGIEAAWSGGYSDGMGKAYTDPRIMLHIAQREQILKTAPEHLQQQIRNQIALLVAEGRSVADAAREIRPLMYGQVPYYAERIARTETVSAYNDGAVQSYGDAGVERKEWLASIDERTREAHAEADGQVVNTHEAFMVDGEEMEYPGDPGASAENVINCRCTVLPVV